MFCGYDKLCFSPCFWCAFDYCRVSCVSLGFLVSSFVDWLWGIISGVWSDLVEFITDIPLIILDSILSAIATILESIPVPDFISSGLSGLSASVDPGILYFIDQSGFAAALSLLGAGLGFRLLRKLFTLGLW